MRILRPWALTIAALSLSAPLALLSTDQPVVAADHVEPPTRTDPAVDVMPDPAADIADIYAWHTDTHLIVALTFGGPAITALPAFYDRDVIYKLFISNAGARTDSEIPITIQFGQNGGVNGVRVKGVPGAAGSEISGPVETLLQSGGVLVRAGLFDDPFFFDSQGLRESRASGTLDFRANRNFFAGKNITAVVIQIPRSAIQNGSNRIDIWSQTLRFGGQI